MLKDKLTVAVHVTRQSGPWVGLAASSLVIAHDLLSKKNS